MYIDGHLDLAFNAVVHKRDLTRKVMAVRADEDRSHQELLVTLPELRRANVGIVFGTLFAIPRSALQYEGEKPPKWKAKLSYATPDEAHALAVDQLERYEQWEDEGRIRILRTQSDLQVHVTAWESGERTVGLVVLMEGADPIRTPDELAWWADRGLRMIGPAWRSTRYAGGTGAPGPLTPNGKALVQAMIEHNIPLDVSHLSNESFWDAMDLAPRYVLASHSNARAISPGDRQMSDDMIRAVGASGGVVGIVLGDAFLHPDHATMQVTLRDVHRHAKHIARLIGWDQVAIGSDFDGGFGVQETPKELTRGADFSKLGKLVPEAARSGFLGGNWLRFLRRVLP
ncbi:MAG: membrane dipeptidase [Longimonas sp.]|uniref:dipeptidase n=1 Tax=Longimonas sp. TaxID=2039626 RepID=UPI003976A999